jgi:aryl-alcohol dehydrogenase-like predicted oxidoreductase
METEQVTMKRTLGRSGIEVSAMGLGCWAIGGPVVWEDGTEFGWGKVDDSDSIGAIRRGLDAGVSFFDTADSYGAGHSEQVLGRALGTDRDRVAIATKFGWTFDDDGSRRSHGSNASPEYVRSACEASLRRLGTDRIDLYQLHIGDLELSAADAAADVLDELLSEGKIRAYCWSTDSLERGERWLARPGYSAIQHNLNVFEDSPELLALCERENLASVNRNPLAMGFLSGKYTKDTRVSPDDFRASGIEWVAVFDENGAPRAEWLAKLEAVREILSSNGRTLVQGAIAWIWGRSPQTIPIPGVKTAAQAEENAGAMQHGPLTPEQIAEIDGILGR